MARKLWGWGAGGNPGKRSSSRRAAHRSKYLTGSSWWEREDTEERDGQDSWLERWSHAPSWSDNPHGDDGEPVGHLSRRMKKETGAGWRTSAGTSAARVIWACKAEMDSGKPQWTDLDARCHRAAGSLYAYDAAIKDWARKKAVGTLKVRGEDADDYAVGVAARAALDLLTMAEWVEFAKHFLPEPQDSDIFAGQQMAPSLDKNSLADEGLDQFARDGRNSNLPESNAPFLQQMEANRKRRDRSHGRANYNPRLLEPGNRENCDDLAAAMEAAARERSVADWAGCDIGPDAPLWACGLQVSPFAEREPALCSPVAVVVMVDGSSSTEGEVAERLSRMAFAFAAALRQAGHSAAVVPWGAGAVPLEDRRGAMFWHDPLPERVPCWEHSGTDLRDAAMACSETFAMLRAKARRIALILTDGQVSGRSHTGRRFDFGADLAALWSFQCPVPDNWDGPGLVTEHPENAMRDLRASPLAAALAGMKG